MNISECHSTVAPSTMPAIPSDQTDSFASAAAAFKKRKRDPVQDHPVNLSHATTFIPSTLYHSNPHPLLECPEIPKENNDLFLRHRCVPRKRRVLQQPYHFQQHNNQQWPSALCPSSLHTNTNTPSPYSPSQPKLLTPNICSQNPSSPPVSPKTLLPISCLQQTTHTSASSLRPCHICHRRPTTREVLDAYADCDLCGQRSCYICLRQCDAPNCCGSITLGYELLADGQDRLQEEINGLDSEAKRPRKICSCCAVEGVTETGLEVVQCLECFRSGLVQWQTAPPPPPPPAQLG